MKKLLIVTVLVTLTTSAFSAEWWTLEKTTGASTFNPGAFITCVQASESPARLFEYARDAGFSPKIIEDNDEIKIEWWNDKTKTWQSAHYFKSQKACDLEAERRKQAADRVNNRLNGLR